MTKSVGKTHSWWKRRHSMKKVFLAGLFLLLVSTSVHAQPVSTTTGNSLLEACESKDQFQKAFCLGYIQGVTDLDGMEGATFRERRRSCVAENGTNGQMHDVAVTDLTYHPQASHLYTPLLLLTSPPSS